MGEEEEWIHNDITKGDDNVQCHVMLNTALLVLI